MSGPHTFINRPPVVYRTTTPWWRRFARRAAVAAAVLCVAALLVAATAALIAKLHATESQLDHAHAMGMSAGMAMCGGRP